jgi:hypothetical protein
MNGLVIIGWSVIAAACTWGFAARRMAATIARLRADTRREIGHWQDQAARARTRAAQLERELASWSAGCRQGREDVVNIVPMLLAAGGHQPCMCQTASEGSQ